MRIWFVILLFIAFQSCQSHKGVDGESIDFILFDRIILSDGQQYIFEQTDSTKIFYLVRHAEKDTVQQDPNLSSEGYQRSHKLYEIFKKTRIDKVYSTMTTRTIMTAEPLVSAKGLKILPYDPQKLEEFSDNLLQDEMTRVCLIVGHSNTTPELFRLLSGEASPVEIGDQDYGYLFVVVMNGSVISDTFYLNY